MGLFGKSKSGAPKASSIGTGNKVDEVIAVCQSISEGDFEARVLNIPTEPGQTQDLCRKVNEMIDRMDAYVRESTACLHYVEQNRYFRRIVEDGMVGAFLTAARAINHAADGVSDKMESFGDLVTSLNTISDTFETKATEMGQTANATQEQSTSVASAATEALTNVQAVASASEELSSSIQEINRQVTQSSTMAAQAVTESGRTSSIISELAEASEQIGEVVGLISNVAKQTNLLALNATIEAARAGEAGKGFAVVAGEVKALASQTEKATGEIEQHISKIQSTTRDAVTSIDGIGQSVTEFNEMSTMIAAAVEEQGAATGEIARNIEEATLGVADITEGITKVSQDADGVQAASGAILSVTGDLATQATTLQQSLERKAS